MHIAPILARMQAAPAAFTALVAGLSDDDLRWRPSENEWSILEVLCHLADEEVEDFRVRLELTLRVDGSPWPPIDPPQAALERNYRGQDARDVLDRFAAERAASIAWLKTLSGANWSAEHHHASLGVLRAGDLLASWAAHDALHLKQIAKRLLQLAQRDAPGFATAYAGDWQA
jgi:hypothetical protein